MAAPPLPAAPIASPTASTGAVRTPCVKTCVVDGASGLCLGCLRTLAEIAGWTALTAPERDAVMAELPGRRARAALQTLAPL